MKSYLYTFLALMLVISLQAQNDATVQYTPNQADWSTFYSKPEASPDITSHAPDGIGWITSWPTWDGTIYNPEEFTPNQFFSTICPSSDKIRGIREVFYNTNPFADIQNPTKAEVDEWHRIAINHVRALVGYGSEERKVKKDHCMFARALWGQQRRFTNMWDAAYPDNTCAGSTNPHCGASFIPSLQDQLPYLPDGHPGCSVTAGAEGVIQGPKSVIPWSVKWSRGFCNFLAAEGFWGPHLGPFWYREKFGLSFWDMNPNDSNSIAVLRAKWTGSRATSLYTDPTLSVSDVADLIASVKVYPNPTSSNLNITLGSNFDTSNTKMTLTNIYGSLIASYPYKPSIEVSNLASGVYIIALNDGHSSTTIKFIKD